LQHPAGEVVLRHPALGIGDEDDELFFHGRRLVLLGGIGLHGEVELLDHTAEQGGVEVVFL